MARVKFGQTWWGNKWLDALSNIDQDNRLSRGRTYYRNGKIDSVSFNADSLIIEGIVSGSAYYPYEVNIGLKPMLSSEKERLVTAIASRPDLVAKLLDGQLDPEIAELAEREGIALFPCSWREFHLSCTCPDTAVPCKHISAVYYSIVNSIDVDPMWVFQLRGVDLVQELKSRQIDIEDAVRLTDPSWEDWRQLSEDIEGIQPVDVQKLPLFTLTPLAEKLCHLVASNGGYKKELTRNRLESHYKYVVAWADAQLERSESQELHWDDWASGLLERDVAPVMIWECGRPRMAISRLRDQRLYGLSVGQTKKMLEALSCTTLQEAAAHSKRMLFWVQITRFTVSLMAKGAFVPMLYRAHDLEEHLSIAWCPAVQDPQVRLLFQMLAANSSLIPVDMVLQEPAAEAPLYGRLYTIVAGLMTAMIPLAMPKRTPGYYQNAWASFVDPDAKLVYGVDIALINAIRKWLSPLSLMQRSLLWSPVLMVRAVKDDQVSLNIGIAERGAPASQRPVLFAKAIDDPKFRQERFVMLSVFKDLAAYCSPIADILSSGGKAVRMPRSDLREFLFDTVPLLTLMGMRVLLPKSLQKILRPSLSAHLSGSLSGGGQGLLTKDALTSFSWQISIGDRQISREEFETMLEHQGEIQKWHDEFVYLDPEVLQSIQAQMDSHREPTMLERLSAALTGKYKGIPVSVSDELLEEVRQLNAVPLLPVPVSLRASLRAYQERGYSWLCKNLRLGFGALIADDMGLGKTLQVIAALTALKEQGELNDRKILVVLPTTLMINWQREVAKFSPSLSVDVYHGAGRRLVPIQERADIILTTYGMMRRDFDLLAAEPWRLLVLDEAQAIKNTSTGVSKAIRAFPVPQVIAMSGTPVENRLSEYWSILSVVQPGLLGDEEEFRTAFARPIECDHDPKAVENFRQLTAPFMLRRLKTDKSIIADLPDKLLSDRYVDLTLPQTVLYQRTLNAHLAKLAEYEAKNDKPKRSAQVLSLITALKQICNSPSQYEKQWSKMPDSGKGEALLELLDQCRNENRKMLIFTQYREMGERLQVWIESATGKQPDFLHGGVSIAERTRMVDAFQDDPSVDVMIISLKAGGTGLNLTAASVVVHYDLWWNPAVENQATDRAYRIGQTRDVLVYRMICAGTFEEKVNEMLAAKSELANMTVVSGENWLGSLPTEDLRKLFNLQQQPV